MLLWSGGLEINRTVIYRVYKVKEQMHVEYRRRRGQKVGRVETEGGEQ